MDRPADTGPDEITDVQSELDRLPDDEPLVTTPGEARCQYLAAEWPGVPEPRWQCILPRLHEGEHRVIAQPTDGA